MACNTNRKKLRLRVFFHVLDVTANTAVWNVARASCDELRQHRHLSIRAQNIAHRENTCAAHCGWVGCWNGDSTDWQRAQSSGRRCCFFHADAVYYYAYSDLLLVTQNCMFIAADVSYG